MPKQNEFIISEYQNEKELQKNYAKLGKKITDVVVHKIGGVTADDPEYWGLREMLTPEMVDMCNKMKLRTVDKTMRRPYNNSEEQTTHTVSSSLDQESMWLNHKTCCHFRGVAADFLSCCIFAFF